ncbi:ADP-ribosylation factor-binding protein GGA3-like isoform X2 [Hypomesus transpacificus]|uniref:ADP-ribosylation factor-binding protein GGA3-like isoform X2 n=1 Tax=Hypomesus transpacificus TaxID=137520 RepID=UPI001F07425F|nr:ADP-ribosylation factor-binding protein GGA3-like isoform X2 [Hypomesus transpacificus]
MATGDSGETLESWLNQATDPSNLELRWDCIQGFYQLVNTHTSGPQVATRLLAHKIQSPQAREALQALTVLEACMNNCGQRFHSEATKFRFLNEMIKVLSPKYLGQWSPEQVKEKVREVLYSWTVWLKDLPKVQEAYSMLKKQGLVKKDPVLPVTMVMPPPSKRTQDSVFDQEDKAKLLARLLNSNRAEDLQTANRLIKHTIKEEQERVDRVSRRVCVLEEVECCTRELTTLLDSGDTTLHSEHMKLLYERCDRLRPNLFRLASDTVDDDSALAQILSANDELTQAVNAYRDRVATSGKGGGAKQNGSHDNRDSLSPKEIKSYHLIDLSSLDSVFPPPPSSILPPSSSLPLSSSLPPPTFRPRLESNLLSLEEELNTLGLDDGIVRSFSGDLLQLCGSVSEQAGERALCREGVSRRTEPCLVARGEEGGGSWEDCWAVPPTQPISLSGSSQPMRVSLADIHVPLQSIRPSRLEPITVFDQSGVHVSLHFAKDTPPGHSNVAVVIVSTVNTSPLPVKDFMFQAAVPKTMQVKLQPPPGQDLPSYKPLLPPASLSQILLLANPQRRKVRLRYRVSLLHGNQLLRETGELEEFPDWSCWVGL